MNIFIQKKKNYSKESRDSWKAIVSKRVADLKEINASTLDRMVWDIICGSKPSNHLL